MSDLSIIDLLVSFLEGVQQWLPALFGLFSISYVAILLAGIMLISGILVFFWVWGKIYIPARYNLDKLIKQITSIPDAESFTKNFPQVNVLMGEVNFVAHGWYELRKHFLFPEQGIKGPIRSTENPSNFINMDSAEDGGLHIRIFHSIPELYVGIGLVFTFLGLVSGLYFASQGLQANDPELARAGLVDLLNA